MMLDLAAAPARAEGPYYLTSANGEVLARRFLDREFARLIDCADFNLGRRPAARDRLTIVL